VKVLFVGEGVHDLGTRGPGFPPHPASGIVFTLARKVCPAIKEGLAIRWPEVISLAPSARKSFDRNSLTKGYAAKVRRAILLSHRWGCEGTVCVADGDTAAADTLEIMMQAAVEGVQSLGVLHHAAVGVAVLSVEAWTLGADEALAQVLELEVDAVRKVYPKGHHVEELFGTSGNLGCQPKRVLQTVAELAHCNDCSELRADVAEVTDIEALESACPKGFAPFAANLRAAFGSGTPAAQQG
jgi:hypothetical protein